jgi:predicted negative regulator of RcsB-dependent stress response
MDEEITIIDSKTRNEKIKHFILNNKKNIIMSISALIILFISYFAFDEIKQRSKIKLANQFNMAIMNFKETEKQITIDEMTNIVNENDITYSPLALYFLIDNNLIDNKIEVNVLFNQLINKTNLDEEIKNLIIYKKALFNSDLVDENELLQIINPIINSESIWKPHALYLVAEYFYSKNEKQKSKEFFSQILKLKDNNREIRLEAQRRINRDFSE